MCWTLTGSTSDVAWRCWSRFWDELSTARLAALGVAPGACCLEIGGGGGSIARWLCQEVGEAGHVTAVDLDTRWLDQLAEPNLTVVQHDLTETDAPFEAASFDFIHARAVFEHIAARDAVLEGVCRWLAPGGWLSVSDCASFSVESTPNPVYGTAMRAAFESLRKTGTDYEWGRCLPAHLQRQCQRRGDRCSPHTAGRPRVLGSLSGVRGSLGPKGSLVKAPTQVAEADSALPVCAG